ncbi:MAG: S8 family serine peptidase [Elusimicrobia bacterium]|nr:S8 family serine peptidase [Elusimicrobiota bacterium]
MSDLYPNQPISIKKIFYSFLVFFLFLFSPLKAKDIRSLNVDGRSLKAVKGEILVKYAGDGHPSPGFLSALSEKGAKSSGKIPGIDVYKYKVPDENLEKVLAELNSRPDIAYARPNTIFYAQVLPPIYNNLTELRTNQWGLYKIQAHDAWNTETGDSKAIIAVVDSGVDLYHPDLKDNIWLNPKETEDGWDSDDNGYIDDVRGWDFVDNDNDPSPNDFLNETHGTHVAGISSAAGVVGVVGVARGSRIMPLKVLAYRDRGDGYMTEIGSSDDIAEAIVYAADNGAHIINLSLGGPEKCEIIESAVEYAYKKDLVIVASSGNEDENTVSWPAAHREVISVGATNQYDRRAFFSNYGSSLDLMAPGVGILSTVPGGLYAEYFGTSMAAPFVSGLAALVVSYCENKGHFWDAEMIKNLLIRHADGLVGDGFPHRDFETGYGRINAQTIMTFLDSNAFRVDFSKPLSYPNPFNPNLQSIMLLLPSSSTSELKGYKIFSLTGRLVREESDLSGTFTRWDGRNNDDSLCASGLYFYQLITHDGGTETGKITLVR